MQLQARRQGVGGGGGGGGYRAEGIVTACHLTFAGPK